jgi:hypothetical protein
MPSSFALWAMVDALSYPMTGERAVTSIKERSTKLSICSWCSWVGLLVQCEDGRGQAADKTQLVSLLQAERHTAVPQWIQQFPWVSSVFMITPPALNSPCELPRLVSRFFDVILALKALTVSVVNRWFEVRPAGLQTFPLASMRRQ